ncbi:MAG TPA: oxygen-independent coproporphyrinogen III oxidase [Clostridiales bacterium]|nr:MAG: hypothetical protein A2Y22_06590 [Clostridiales bacterium GWD2_32_59]HAN09891.1 oxygen-independent coproporphyrinogen III oxidase [Clostridiales bacterium]
MKEIGLYIHIPFCESKCFYCDFLSFDNKSDNIEGYINLLCEDIVNLKDKLNSLQINTIFIGGGTPSILSTAQLEKLLYCMLENINMKYVKEFSIESNPNSLTLDKIKIMKDYKINRVSIGLQAWQDELLKKLGRVHTQKDFLVAYNNLKNQGIDNINVDLMFSLPNQTLAMLKETLYNVSKLDIKHISFYGLTLEKGTKMMDLYTRGGLDLPDEKLDREMYHLICDFLSNIGYNQYEISNFAKDGYECKHNLIYWDAKEYLGLGLGAHSYYNNERYHNTKNIDIYSKEVLNNNVIQYNIEKIDTKAKYEEFMFLGLRKTIGVSKLDFRNIFGVDIDDVYLKTIDGLINKGLIEHKGDYIRLTRFGIDVSNKVLLEFLL